MCWRIQKDFEFLNSDVMAIAMLFISVILLWCLGNFIMDNDKKILNCIVHDNQILRYMIVKTLEPC